MTTHERLNLFPSRANYVFVKQRMLSAQKGLVLLKRKRDALELKLREFKSELNKHRDVCDQTIRDANFSMARLDYLGTDLKPHSMLSVSRADIFLRFSYLKTIGVSIPQFDISIRPAQSFPLTGLSRGGIEVDKVRNIFQDALKTLSAMASADYSVKVLEGAVHSNNMRLNGLELVVIPRFHNTLMYIRDEMDEFEREDFYRLKRGQAKRMEKLKQDIEQMRHKIDDPEKFMELSKEKQAERKKNQPDWKSIFKKKYEEAKKTRQELLKLLEKMERMEEGEEEEYDTEIGYEGDGELQGAEEDDDFYYTEGMEGEVELKQRSGMEPLGSDIANTANAIGSADPDAAAKAGDVEEVVTEAATKDLASSSGDQLATEAEANAPENVEEENIISHEVPEKVAAKFSKIHSVDDDDSGSSATDEVLHNRDVITHPEADNHNARTANEDSEQVQESEPTNSEVKT